MTDEEIKKAIFSVDEEEVLSKDMVEQVTLALDSYPPSLHLPLILPLPSTPLPSPSIIPTLLLSPFHTGGRTNSNSCSTRENPASLHSVPSFELFMLDRNNSFV